MKSIFFSEALFLVEALKAWAGAPCTKAIVSLLFSSNVFDLFYSSGIFSSGILSSIEVFFVIGIGARLLIWVTDSAASMPVIADNSQIAGF